MLHELEAFAARWRLVWLAAAILLALAFLSLVESFVYLVIHLVARAVTQEPSFGRAVIDEPWASAMTALLSFGLIAGVLVLGLRRVDRGMRDCPSCLSRIPRAASVCRYCSSDIAAVWP